MIYDSSCSVLLVEQKAVLAIMTMVLTLDEFRSSKTSLFSLIYGLNGGRREEDQVRAIILVSRNQTLTFGCANCSRGKVGDVQL